MSPAKKTTRRATAKKKTPRRKVAGKKAKTSKARATKKKAAKSAPAPKKKAPKPAPAPKKKVTKAAPAAKKKVAKTATEKARAASTASAALAEAPAAAPDRKAARKKSARKTVAPAPPPDAHPKFGVKHTCFQCSAKFYDLFRPEPLCPKCGADQRAAPKVETTVRPVSPRKRVSKRNMAPLLDEDEDEPPFEEAGESDLGLGQAGAAFDDPTAEVEDEVDL